MIFLHAAAAENTLQTVSAEGAHLPSRPIILDAGEVSSQMVLLAACKIFQAVFVLYGNDKPAACRQMG